MKTHIIGFLQVVLIVALVVAAIIFSREDKTGVPGSTQFGTSDAHHI